MCMYRRAMYLYKTREMVDLLGTYSDDIYLGGDYAKYIRGRGLDETLITAETYVNPFPETHVDVSDPLSPFTSLLFAGATFFPLTIAIVPSCVPSLPRRSHSPFLFTDRAASASGIRYIRGSLCFMANCFIIFDIFPVYGRGSTFCFMAVYCA